MASINDFHTVTAMSRTPEPGAPVPWLRNFRHLSSPRLRLVCFPHAGGQASFFRSWPDRAPAEWEVSAVRYPGREERIVEPCMTGMDELSGAIAEALAPGMSTPTAFFGHSMGAAVAHEVSARLAASGPVPVMLFVSARPAPHRVRRFGDGDLSDDALLRTMAALGGPGAELLAMPELRDLILPPVRADFQLLDDYVASPKAGVIDVPIVSYRGDADTSVDAEDMQAWDDVTTAGHRSRTFDGDHFYLVPHERALIDDVAGRLAVLA